MAGHDMTTIGKIVQKVLCDEHAEVIRESVRAVAREIMEAEAGESVGAERRERGRRIA